MRIKNFRFEVRPFWAHDGRVTLRVEVVLENKRIVNYEQTYVEDHFECLFDRLMEEANREIKKLIKEDKDENENRETRRC
jgi:hypothetical protein